MAKFITLHKLSGKQKGQPVVINVEKIFAVTPVSEAVPQHTAIFPEHTRASINVFESFKEVDRIISEILR